MKLSADEEIPLAPKRKSERADKKLPIGQVSNWREGHPGKLMRGCRAHLLLQRQNCLTATRFSEKELLRSIFAIADVEIYMIRRICLLERYECNSMHR
jgi:hypothetical protein